MSEPLDQISRDELRNMQPEAIRDAMKDGRLDELLGRPDRTPKPPPLDADEVELAAREDRLDQLLEVHRAWKPGTRERLGSMPAEDIAAALKAGELDGLLRGEDA